MKTNVSYNVIPFWQPRDILASLEEGLLLETFLPKGRYDEHLLETVFPIMFSHPVFRDFVMGLKPVDAPGFRIGDEVPVLATTYNISIDEARVMGNNPDVLYKFMASMSNALVNKSIPYDEVVAILMDAIYTSDYVMFTPLHNVH